MRTAKVLDVIDDRRVPLVAGLAGGVIGSNLAMWRSLQTPIEWSPRSNTSSGWFGSPGLDALTDQVNHNADIAVWLASSATQAGMSFVSYGIAFGVVAWMAVRVVRFGGWFAVNFRLR